MGCRKFWNANAIVKSVDIKSMNEWYGSWNNPNSDFRKLLQERIDIGGEWLSTLDCTNKRIRNILSALRTALGVAVQDGILANNILKGWS